MTKFDLKALAISCTGALLLSATCIGAAVGPVMATPMTSQAAR